MIAISCVLSILILSPALAASTPPSFYVAEAGDDSWTGQYPEATASAEDGPFATLAGAVEGIRAFRTAHPDLKDSPITLLLRKGSYHLDAPITLAPEDSHLRIAAYQDEAVTLSGGLRITGWEKEDGPLWSAPLPEGPDEWIFRSLRVGDAMAIRARHPNYDPDQPRKGGWFFSTEVPLPKATPAFNTSVSHTEEVGSRIEWDLEIPEAGAYSLWVYYAHNMKNYNIADMAGRTRFGSGDTVVNLENLPDTGGWSKRQWAKSATIDLEAGMQRLFWENVKGGGIDLDAFCLSLDTDWNPATAITIAANGTYQMKESPSGNSPLLFQAESFVRSKGDKLQVSTPKPGRINDRLAMRPGDFPDWKSWADAELHIFPAWGWVNTITPILGNNPETSLLRLNCKQDIRPGNRYFIAGVQEALDSPGEWWLDRVNKRLYYWPLAGDPNTQEIVAPCCESLFVLQGAPEEGRFVEDIQFSGLCLKDSTYTLDATYSPSEAGIVLAGARACSIDRCTFKELGGYAVHLHSQSRENSISRNTIKNLGQGGVIMTGDLQSQPRNNHVLGNTISDCGRIYKHVAGVYVTTGSGNRIAWNRIRRMPRYGVSLKSFSAESWSHNNIVEYNEIIDMNLETNDTGGIETLGRDRQNSGNIIRFNLIRNVVGMKTTPTGEILSPHFTWGIYLDDYSSGTLVYGNLVDGNTIGGICIHGGKDNRIENNLFLNASEQQLRLQPRDDFMQGNTFKHNVVAYEEADSTLWYAYAQTWRPDRLAECDYNIYWCFDDFDIATTDKEITPEGPYAAWLKTGHDAHSLVADPGFRSVEGEAYILSKDSPAFQLGIKALPFPLDFEGENF